MTLLRRILREPVFSGHPVSKRTLTRVPRVSTLDRFDCTALHGKEKFETGIKKIDEEK